MREGGLSQATSGSSSASAPGVSCKCLPPAELSLLYTPTALPPLYTYCPAELTLHYTPALWVTGVGKLLYSNLIII